MTMHWKRRRNGVLAPGMAVAMLLAGAAPLWPQATGTIQGRVTAEVTAQPLSLVRIYAVENPRLQATTGEDGRYTLRGLPAGSYTIRASMLGFSRLETAVSVAGGRPSPPTLSFGERSFRWTKWWSPGPPGRRNGEL